MGSCFGKQSPVDPWGNLDLEDLKDRISVLEKDPHRENLESRLASLEAHADLNRDGIVTRQEMETYMATQLKLREDELIRLNHENEALKESLLKADQRYEALLEKIRTGDTACIQASQVSAVAIEKEIQKWLDDPKTNFKVVPDRVEMFAYKKMLGSLLGGMEKLFETFALEFMGHRVMVTMQPISLDPQNDAEGES